MCSKFVSSECLSNAEEKVPMAKGFDLVLVAHRDNEWG